MEPVRLEDYVILYADNEGKHLIAMPNGEKVPRVAMTRVTQDTTDSRSGYCNIFVMIRGRIATPDEARALSYGAYGAEDANNPKGGV